MRAPDFWYRRPGLASAALAPLAWAYAAVGDRLRTRPGHRAPVPVICVGNLVAGGSGKTPVVQALARLLVALGRAPHLLSRGHSGRTRGPHRVDPARDDAARVGDEPLMLARTAPVWVGRDRGETARRAVAAGADVLVMDDGFQNPTLDKDLSLLVIDGRTGFGNGRVHPAGPLREPLEAGLARADAALVIGTDAVGVVPLLDRAGLRVLRARTVPTDGMAERFAGRRVVAFAGIGRPSKLFDGLAELGADLVDTKAFPDHHPYRARDLADLRARAAGLNAELVTTEKDLARLASRDRAGIAVLGIRIAVDAPDRLNALISDCLDRAAR